MGFFESRFRACRVLLTVRTPPQDSLIFIVIAPLRLYYRTCIFYSYLYHPMSYSVYAYTYFT